MATRVVRILVLGNAAAGAEKQAVALAERLHSQLVQKEGVQCAAPSITRLQLRRVTSRMPPILQVLMARVTQNPFFGYDMETREKVHVLPSAVESSNGSQKDSLDVVIGCGRSTISLCAALKWARAASQGGVYNIQIQHPRVPLSWFSAVIAPRHDFRPFPSLGPRRNVFLTAGTVHDITPELLATHAQELHHELAPYIQDRRVRITWLIGGPCRGYAFTESQAEAMATQFISVVQDLMTTTGKSNVGLLVTFSRRTPPQVESVIHELLKAAFPEPEQLFVWDGSGKNPYYALLAEASVIVTTPDSISMTTEATASQKTVFTLSADQCKGKFQRFHQTLLQANLTRPFTREAAQDILATTSTSSSPAPCTAIEEELNAIVSSIGSDIRTKVKRSQ